VMKANILVVDDEFSVRDSLFNWFRMDGHRIVAAEDANTALRHMRREQFDVVFLDIKMPGIDGIELQRRIHEMDSSIAVIMITAFATVETAVQALKQGAFDYVTKPIDPDEMSLLVQRALERRHLRDENKQLREALRALSGGEDIVGDSPAMQGVMDQVRRVAQTEATVLIRGETGTGKELLARAIHENSDRRNLPIVPVSCGSLPDSLLETELFGHEQGAFTGARYRRKGKLELANGGTLFLDEIGAVSAKTQVDLLRVLESKEFTRLGGNRVVKADFRIICATNEDLEEYVREGRFREDLYYRINVFTIRAPPLRERRSDIPALAKHFLDLRSRQLGKPFEELSTEAMSLLTAHDWPGNVRELANAIERAVVMGKPPSVRKEDLSFLQAATSIDLGELSLEAVERQHVTRMLERHEWNISATAESLGIDRGTLYNKIKKYGLRG
jgi:DNA-binding NtrC family response regulator